MRKSLHKPEQLAKQLQRLLGLRQGPAFRLALRMSQRPKAYLRAIERAERPKAYLRAIERAERFSTETTRIIRKA